MEFVGKFNLNIIPKYVVLIIIYAIFMAIFSTFLDELLIENSENVLSGIKYSSKIEEIVSAILLTPILILFLLDISNKLNLNTFIKTFVSYLCFGLIFLVPLLIFLLFLLVSISFKNFVLTGINAIVLTILGLIYNFFLPVVGIVFLYNYIQNTNFVKSVFEITKYSLKQYLLIFGASLILNMILFLVGLLLGVANILIYFIFNLDLSIVLYFIVYLLEGIFGLIFCAFSFSVLQSKH
jgi:hypothetical protein